MKNFIVFAFIFLVAPLSLADDVVTWKHPTQYTDGTALKLEDIDRTIIRWFNQADPSIIVASAEVIAPAVTTTIPRDTTVVGTICYQGATLMKPTAGGRQSGFAPTDGACKTISIPTGKKPKMPSNVQVQ